MKNIYLLALQVLLCMALRAQKPGEKTNNFRFSGIKVGTTFSDYYRKSSEAFRQPINWPHLGLQGSFVFDFFNRKNSASELEISFATKGAKETFTLNDKIIKENSRLRYLQVNYLPIILKPAGNKRFDPYIALGLYSAYLLNGNSETTIEQQVANKVLRDRFINVDFPKSLKNFDLGPSGSIGFVHNAFTYEYRYEIGLLSVIKNKEIKNNVNVISVKFSY
jgi:hypothetical protein